MKLTNRLFAWYLAGRIPKEAEKMFGKNWKTSMGGIVAILGGLAAIGKCVLDGHLTVECIGPALGAIGAGWVGLAAKDHDTSGVGVMASKVGE